MEEIESLVKKIKSCINNLEKRYDFTELKHKNSILVFKDCINKYNATDDLDYIRIMLTEWHKTSTPTIGTKDAYEKTIWDMNVDESIITLDDLFLELESTYVKHHTI